MKKIIILAALTLQAFKVMAIDYSYSSQQVEMPGWLVVTAIIMITWGILEKILFFKVWGMTNDIRELKKDFFNEIKYESQGQMKDSLRKKLILGDLEKVKKTFLIDFINSVESSFEKMKALDYEKDEHGSYHMVSSKEKNLKKSIRPNINQLQKQFEMIGEEVPDYIKRMETFQDYYSLFTEEENGGTKVEISTDKEIKNPLANPETANNIYVEQENENKEQLSDRRTTTTSKNDLYFITIPIFASLVFFVGVVIFHANYSFSELFVEESSILIPAFIVYVIALGIYYAIIWSKKKKSS